MPIECSQLEGTRQPLDKCPRCGAYPFRAFMRGQVQRWPWKFLLWGKRPYCAVICWECKNIVGYE
jgi:hypothetical protein